MLKKIVQELDERLQGQQLEEIKEAVSNIRSVRIEVIGQFALIEANLSIDITATMDLDLMNQLQARARREFEMILKKYKLVLDPVGHEAWMPEETSFVLFYEGDLVKAYLAEPVYVILSKAKVAPQKNNQLIADYLASRDLDERVFELAKKYKVNLDDFV